MPKKKRSVAVPQGPTIDPKVRGAFERLLSSCSRAAMDLFDHDCTCVFHGHVKDIAKEVKTLMDLQKGGS